MLILHVRHCRVAHLDKHRKLIKTALYLTKIRPILAENRLVCRVATCSTIRQPSRFSANIGRIFVAQGADLITFRRSTRCATQKRRTCSISKVCFQLLKHLQLIFFFPQKKVFASAVVSTIPHRSSSRDGSYWGMVRVSQ